MVKVVIALVQFCKSILYIALLDSIINGDYPSCLDKLTAQLNAPKSNSVSRSLPMVSQKRGFSLSLIIVLLTF